MAEAKKDVETLSKEKADVAKGIFFVCIQVYRLDLSVYLTHLRSVIGFVTSPHKV